jgi:hypothetical protein
MHIEILIEGKSVVKADIDMTFLAGTLSPSRGEVLAKSSPMTKAQAEELLARIDSKSAQLLRQIAANNGVITWDEMRAILGIGIDDWNVFSAGRGKGITRALRHILGDRSARLIWWNDDEWVDDKDPLGPVYIDGLALQALREIGGVA